MTLSFKLARPADVTATVVRDGSVLRTMQLGALERGVRSLVWDGALDDDRTITSGPCCVRLTADGVKGVTSVEQPLVVDLTGPRVAAPARVVATYPLRAKVAYVVRDAHSPKVRVAVAVTDARGRIVARSTPGWAVRGKRRSWVWRPRARGVYSVIFSAVDRGGNQRSPAAAVKLVVR